MVHEPRRANLRQSGSGDLPRRGRVLAVAIVLAAQAWSCGEPSAPEQSGRIAASIDAPDYVYVDQLGQAALTVLVRDSAAVAITDAPVSFTSGNPSALAVSDEGVVTSVGKAGIVPVTVRSGTARAIVDVVVRAVPQSMEVVGEYVFNLPPGDSVYVTIVVHDLIGDLIPSAALFGSSQDTSVVTIGGGSWIRAVGPGSTEVDFSVAELQVSVYATVFDPAVIHGQVRVKAPSGIAVAPSGLVYVAQWLLYPEGAIGGIVVLDPARLTKVDSLFSRTFAEVSVGPDDQHLFANDIQADLLGVDLAARTVTPYGVSAGRMLPSRDRGSLYVLAGDRVRRLDPLTLNVLAEATVMGTADGAAMGLGDSLIYVTTRTLSARIYELDGRTLETRRTISIGGDPIGAVIDPGGDYLYVANAARGLDIVDLTAGELDAMLPLGVTHDLCLSADGSELFVTLADSGRVVVVNLASRDVSRVVWTFGHPIRPHVTPDGQYLVTSNGGGWVDVIYTTPH